MKSTETFSILGGNQVLTLYFLLKTLDQTRLQFLSPSRPWPLQYNIMSQSPHHPGEWSQVLVWSIQTFEAEHFSDALLTCRRVFFITNVTNVHMKSSHKHTCSWTEETIYNGGELVWWVQCNSSNKMKWQTHQYASFVLFALFVWSVI